MSRITSTNGFNIDWSHMDLKSNNMIVPFKIIIQSNTKRIETYVKKTWNNLLNYNQRTPAENLELYKMRAYILKELKSSSSEIERIHDYFYSNRWFSPLSKQTKITKISLDSATAAMWANPDLPYLEIKGKITLNLDKIISIYLMKKYLNLKFDDKFIKPDINLIFQNQLPLFIRFEFNMKLKQKVLDIIKTNFNNSNSKINRDLSKGLKIKNIGSFNKKIYWKTDNIISIEIDDMLKLLKIKTKKNILPLSIGGYLLNKFL